MKKLLTVAALLAFAAPSKADCSPPIEFLVGWFADNEALVVHGCKLRYPMHDLEQCLDWQFNEMRKTAALCDNEGKGAQAVAAGTILNRRGERVGVDFPAATLEALRLGAF